MGVEVATGGWRPLRPTSEVRWVVAFTDRDRGGSVGGTEAASGPREPSDDMVFT
jgi:hypothetical protein